MWLIILTLSVFFSCIESEFPKPDQRFLEDENHDKDGDGFTENMGDCDDADAEINPLAEEICDELDNNCNGVIDADSEESPTWYRDADGDAVGVEAFTENACTRPDGYVAFFGDCDDEDPDVNPNAEEVCDDKDNNCNTLTDDEDDTLYAPSATLYYIDADGDGFGWIGTSYRACAQPNGMVENSTDCDDSNRFSNPEGVETCDGVDNDCDFMVDDEDDDIDLSTMPLYYPDNDMDNIGANVEGIQTCEQPTGYVLITGDCDDNNAMIYPAAVEICDGFDNNCDDGIDDEDAIDAEKWYLDNDGDTYGVQAFFVEACDKPEGYVAFFGDCDDGEAAVNPGAIEICDSLDNDCDQMVDDQDTYWLRGTENIFYGDGDGDGFGWPGFFVEACFQPPGMVSNLDDCDDNNRFINPSRNEICDGLDNDCDDLIDDDDTDNLDAKDGIVMYPDADADGYGDENLSVEACLLQNGYIEQAGDCDDENNDIHEGQDEYCDDIDNNCNGQVDEDSAVDAFTWYVDGDADSYGDANSLVLSCFDMPEMVLDTNDCNDGDLEINPDAVEICDGLDNDCNGQIDEEDSDLLPTEDDYYFIDVDGDGYGVDDSIIVSCSPLSNYVQIGGDCNDDDLDIYPNRDADLDSWDACGGDCDDDDLSINPYGQDLVNDGIDQDCDGQDAQYQIDLGLSINCGISEGELRCWGDGREDTPKLKNAMWIEVGLRNYKTGCSMMSPNDIQCFGFNSHLSVQSTNSFVQFEHGANHMCLLSDEGVISCVGNDQYGKSSPPSLTVHQISSGQHHNCAIDRTGSIYCWGRNDNGQGEPPSGKWIQVSVGREFTCALDENYEISCWGVNDVGQTDAPTGTYTKISSGIEHACALTLDNNVECWGQISEVPELQGQIIDLQSGEHRSCVLYANGDLECWGASGSNLLNVDVDEDGSSVLLDCNDDRSDLYPQDLDADGYSPCDGDCDDTTSAIGYVDADGDGFACLLDCDDTSASKNGNDVDGDGFSSCQDDCNDNNALVNPTDADGDGYTLCDGDCRDDDPTIGPRDDADGDGFEYCNDCDDNDANVYPGSAYLESDIACMIDADGDGWGEDLTELCCAEILLEDSYGNGWDGASLQAFMDGDLIAEFTLEDDGTIVEDGRSEVKSFCFPDEGEVTWQYLSGSWDSENSYVISDPDGGYVFQDGPFPTTELQYTTFMFPDYSSEECIVRASYDSGNDCNDSDASLTGEDKDNDGSRLCDGDCDDFDPNITGEDVDGDGVSACNGDCDDSNPFDMTDLDGDGYTGCDGDCNDYSSNVRPLAIELMQDGIDQDCDGLDLDIMVSAGTNHSCAIGLEKNISCWGDPFAVDDTPDRQDVVYLSSGGNTTVGITDSAELVCWGIHCSDLPSGNFIMVSQGETHGCGIDTSGSLQCWGEFSGIGNVPSGEFVRVAAGNQNTCAIKRDQNLTCWGKNENGETTEKPNGSFLDIQGNDGQFCALTTAGKLKCWGDVGDEQRPNGTFTDISVGYQSGCVLEEDGEITCWGMIEEAPDYKFASISSGYDHACGVDFDNMIHCWGGFEYAKNEVDRSLCTTLIDGDDDGYLACEDDCDDNDPTVFPVDIDGDGYNPCTGDCDENVFHSNLADIDGDGSTVGCDNDCNDFSSALNTRDRDSDGWTTCDGDCDDTDINKNLDDVDNDSWTTCDGDLLDTNFLAYPYATDIIRDGIDQNSDGIDGQVMIASGNDFACSLDMNGSLECFGSNDSHSQLSDVPDGTFKQVVVGDDHACALDLDDLATCWGSNESAKSMAPSEELYMLSAGSKHSCALKSSGDLTCWGSIATPPSTKTYVHVVSGSHHACAIDTTGNAECWGSNTQGQNNIDEGQVLEVVAGNDYTCVQYRDGETNCYGSISNIPYEGTFSKIFGGPLSVCGLQGDDILCWNSSGIVEQQNLQNGLEASYYDVRWTEMQDFSLYTPYSNEVYLDDIADESGWDEVFGSGLTDYVAVLFEGYLYIESDGTYMFQLESDDGSMLYIDDELVIDNDGMHGNVQVEGGLSLSEGYHKLRVEYFENKSIGYMAFRWLDGNSYVSVPSELFYNGLLSTSVQDISIGTDHLCYVLEDNTFECTGNFSNTSDENWCSEFIDNDSDGNSICGGDCDDENPLLNNYDYDGDGISTCDGDCNDGDSNIGEADNDSDLASDCSEDCDPTSPFRAPTANEFAGDGIDQNCDGVDQSFAISAGNQVACVVREDRSLDCWGNSTYGKLNTPDGIFLDVEVADQSVCALDENQEIQCWGLDQEEQLEYPNGTFRQLSGGGYGYCALDENQEIQCWGKNNLGQSNAPNGSFLQVSRGFDHACALSTSGEILCWGDNYYGQLNAPFGTFQKISAGVYYNCALDMEGNISCWGQNFNLQSQPPEGTFVDLKTGYYTACAVGEDGLLSCWGRDSYKETEVPSLFVSDFDMGHYGGCAITTDNSLVCWGYDYDNILSVDSDGDGYDKLHDCDDSNRFLQPDDVDRDGFSTCDGDRHDESDVIHLYDYDEDGVTSSAGDCDDGDASVVPVDEDGDGFSVNCDGDCDDNNSLIHPHAQEMLNDGVDQDCDGEDTTEALSLGNIFSCGLNKYGEISCWGSNTYNGLNSPDGTFLQISSGANHSCALDENQEIQCWGDNGYGQLNAPNGTYVFISSNENTSCAIDENGQATCWGHDYYDLMGDIPEGTYTSIYSGSNHICALDVDNYVRCWGDAGYYGVTKPPNKRYQKLSLGQNHACALDFFGNIDCWGFNGEQQSQAPAGEFVDLSVGAISSCAITSDGSALCWGNPGDEKLNVPEANWTSIVVGYGHICGLTTEEELQCWGSNYYGHSSVDSDGDGNNKLYDCEDSNRFLNVDDVDGDGLSSCDGDRDDNDASINSNDADGDGVSSNDGDCDDFNSNIVPIDEDGDGFSVNCDDDCDDSNRWIYPNARELIGDGIDQDCDGTDAIVDFRTKNNHNCVIRQDGTLDCWGYSSQNNLIVPDGIYHSVGTGSDHNCALDENGEISCWGSAYNNYLEHPTGEFVFLDVGHHSSCVLDELGEISCWGYGINEQSSFPERDWIQLALGTTVTCGLDTDLFVTCWGQNNYLQLGVPQERLQQIAMGDSFGCGLGVDGEIRCWGDNRQGQTDAPTGIFHSIYAGYYAACALDEEGYHTCWGQNSYDMFDLPDIQYSHLNIASQHICGIGLDEKLYCAGSNSYTLTNIDFDNDSNDKLRDCDDYHPFLQQDDADEDGFSTCGGDRNDFNSQLSPEDADEDGISSDNGDCSDNDASVVPIDGDGDGFSSNCDGDCDDNNFFVYSGATELIGDGIDQDCNGVDKEVMLSSGDHNNCLLDEDGNIYCWGDYNTYNESVAPAGSFSYVDNGSTHTCAIGADGSITCWGNSSYDRTNAPAGEFVQLDLSSDAACALSATGEISCWGYNYEGKNNSPEGTYISVAQGNNFSCAIDTNSSLTCWGANHVLQSTPPIERVTQVELGENFGCALGVDGKVLCWGSNAYGQLNTPEGTFSSIHVSYRNACALDEQGNGSCWGENNSGQNNIPDRTFKSISLGSWHGCGHTTEDTLLCWGYTGNRTTVDFDNDGADLLNDCYDNDVTLGVGDTADCPAINCKNILDIHQSRPDDLYYINPTGDETYLVDCDMSNGGFTKVFSHDTSGGLFFADITEAESSQINDPEADLYSILDRIDDIASSDEQYEFRMLWPDSSISLNHWSQSSNPVLSSVVEDYTAIDVDCLTNNWRGLSLSSSPNTLIDGTDAVDEWYGIGTLSGGIPNGCGAGSYVDKVELWLK